MKTHIYDKEQLDNSGTQVLVINSLNKAQPGDAELVITKKAYEGEEFFSIANKLLNHDQELAFSLVDEWIRDKAWKLTVQYLPKCKLDEVHKLFKLYAKGVYYISDNLGQLVNVLKENDNCESNIQCMVERLIRSYYPKLGKNTKKFHALNEFVRESFIDGINLFVKADIVFIPNKNGLQVG